MGLAKFNSKVFNDHAFGKYTDNVPNTKKNALIKSKIIGTNTNARNALSGQGGSLYATVPYHGQISGKTSQNNDGGTDITTSSLTTYDQGFVVVSRMDAWRERDFSTYITAGVNFMDNVAEQIAEYKIEVKEDILLAILEGIYNMDTTSGTLVAEANKEFAEKHTYDISDDEEGIVRSTTLNRAIQRAGGDNKDIFKLVIMHSECATNLEGLQLLKYLTRTDSYGIERDLSLATWNGRTVLIDDNMPVTYGNPVDGEDENSAYYTTYILGENSIILDELPVNNGYEMKREALINGGEDILITRDRYLVGVNGISFIKPPTLTTSPTNEDLANGDNWTIINNGETAIDHKSISIARIISKG